MTRQDVERAKETLEREGRAPSLNAVLQRLGHGSKRDVARLMQELSASDVPVPLLPDPPVPAVPDMPIPALAALADDSPGPLLTDDPVPSLSDVLVPPLPAPPVPPLHQARQQRDQTALAEDTLGRAEQRLKVARQAVEQAELALTIQRGSAQQSDIVDLAHRGRQRALALQRMQIEAERLQVHRTRRDACEATLQTADAYHAAQGQAARWLRRLREAQRQGQIGRTAAARGDAREAVDKAQAELARLVGRAEAEALADDPALQPAWLRE